MPRIRPATTADEQAIRTLHLAAVRERGPDAYSPDQVEAWAAPDIDRDPMPTDDPDHHVVVAERNDTVVGFGHLHEPEREVVGCYVHPDHDRRGVGSTVLAHLEGYALGRGHGTLHLTASMNAVDFYRRTGYRVVEETELDRSDRVDGVTLPVAEMEKSLG